jgi:SpoIID/LytB domain protein
VARIMLTAASVKPSCMRRVAGLAVALMAVAILSGFVFAPAASAAAGDFIITGRGYGQGQGMSQWGAWQGARAGSTYQQILAFYYPGTTLSTMAAVAPARDTITVRITTSVDSFASVELKAQATSATLVDPTGATIQTLAVGDGVTLVYSGGKVQVSGAGATYDYVDLKPDSAAGQVTVIPSTLWSGGDRSYWGFIRIKPDTTTSQVLIHNILPIEKFVSGVAEIAPEWAMPSNTSYYALEAVKAQAVAARTYVAAHTSTVPYDDTRDMNYVGYDYEVTLPGVTQATQETAGVVVTSGGKLITSHFSSSSGGYTTNSAWSDTVQVAYEPAQPDPWSLTGPPTNPGYAWSVTISPATLAAGLAGYLSPNVDVGTITQVDVIARDAPDPGAHARTLRVTGSAGTATISARTFQSLMHLKSTLILSIVKDGSFNRYQQNDANLAYAGTWTASSATAASGGSFRYTNAAGSCSVSFNGTYVAWLAKKSPAYGIAKLTLDGVDQGTVDLYNATSKFGKVWETGTLPDGTHTLKIEWTGTKNTLATDKNISVDAFDISGNVVPAPKLNLYQQSDSRLLYSGAWTVQSASAASGGSFRYTDAAGSCTVSFNGTYIAWLGKMKSTYGKAKVTVDGVVVDTVDLYKATEVYKTVWSKNLAAGDHTVTISWTGTKNSSATDYNICVDAFSILGTIIQAPGGSRLQQDVAGLTYAGSWAPFSTAGASGGSYARANTSGASVTIKFSGTYLGWIATRGTTLGKALVSLDGGTAQSVDLARTSVQYQQNVWNTGMLTLGSHTVAISWDPSNAAGKFISVDAIDLVGSLE